MADGCENQNMVEIAGKDTSILKGTCMEMCPARERTLREKQRRLHPFEVLQDSRNQYKPKADSQATVKEFSRPAAGRYLEADELRPASVLVKTINFLLRDILAKSSPWFFKCEFVSDRIRAIRQDLTAQHIIAQEALDILEKATRYYIVTAVQLCQEPVENFDPVLHNTHTQECLKRLLFLYEYSDLDEQGYRNRPSFEACYLLHNLENPQAYYRLCQLSEKLRKSNVMQLAINLTKAFLNQNFVRVFRILTQLPYLESAAFFRHIQPIRCQALEIMNTAYSSKNLSYPLSSFAKIFYFESKDIAMQFCSEHGIRILAEKVYFSKGQFVKAVKHASLPCHVFVGSKCKGDLTDVLLFHKQSDCDKVDTEEKHEELLETQVEVDQLVPRASGTQGNQLDIQKLSSPVSMVGVSKEGLVPSQGYRMGRGRGRGRARKLRQSNIS